MTSDCGFGREGLSRRIAYDTCVSLVEGTNMVRRELSLPEARGRTADPTRSFASVVEEAAPATSPPCRRGPQNLPPHVTLQVAGTG